MAFYPTVKDLLAVNAARSPESVALIDPEQEITLTFGDLDKKALALSGFLVENGINPGDRIAFFLTNAVEFPVSLFATARIGATFVPINYRVSVEELRYILEDSQPTALIFDGEGRGVVEQVKERVSSVRIFLFTGEENPDYAVSFRDALAHGAGGFVGAAVRDESTACILYTSGTTGRPKGVVYTHRGFVASGRAWTNAAKYTPMDRSIALGPMYHVGGMLASFMPTFHMGGSNVILKQFEPVKVLRWITEYRITVMWATPTHINMMLAAEGAQDWDLSSLRVIQYSGAPIHLPLLRRLRSVFGNVGLINAYGSTELVAVSCVYPEEHDDHLGSVGRALPETFVRLVRPGERNPDGEVEKGEVGEIIVRSPCLMKEYRNLPDKTHEVVKDDWFFTGDLARMEEEGYLHFIERQDDMILSGGENIYPLEVEEVIAAHQKVRAVAVVGMPDETWGEVVAAFVVKADNSVTAEELDRFCLASDRLARYKRPRRYIFVKELPTTSSGKVDKKVLRRHQEE
jgi:long-chain acyl-CoA synthetase